jgi:2-keto-4-pentenoate hydratase
MTDFLANGAYVLGTPREDWRKLDLAQLEAYVAFDGRERARRVAGHPSRDPLLPAIALINNLRRSTGVGEGKFVTTGSYAGMSLAPPVCEIQAGFVGFGEVALRLA